MKKFVTLSNRWFDVSVNSLETVLLPSKDVTYFVIFPISSQLSCSQMQNAGYDPWEQPSLQKTKREPRPRFPVSPQLSQPRVGRGFRRSLTSEKARVDLLAQEIVQMSGIPITGFVQPDFNLEKPEEMDNG